MAQGSLSGIATYDIDTSPRGLVLVFRLGSTAQNFRRDAEKVENTYRALDYDVFVKSIASKDKMLRYLQKICESPLLSEYSTLHTFIISHGTDGSRFFASDGHAISMDEILPFYSDNHCTEMKGKPKLFFCQFCRGGKDASQLNTKGKDVPRAHGYNPQSSTAEALNDIYIAYSSQNGITSWADPQNGSPFIEAFCNTLVTHKTLHLEDFMVKFIQEYEQMLCGQPIEEFRLNFSKKFRFVPGRKLFDFWTLSAPSSAPLSITYPVYRPNQELRKTTPLDILRLHLPEDLQE